MIEKNIINPINPKKATININLNDNAKKATVWISIVIITVAFFMLVINLLTKKE